MDYPVLVNPGKPLRALMKKKTNKTIKVPASGTGKGGKTASKTSGKTRKVASPRGSRSKAASAAAPKQVAPNDAKPAIRRLRAQLAQAQARIDELQASADTDFLLEIPPM
jgi:hypothetical protein